MLSIYFFISGTLQLATKGSVSRLKKNLFHDAQPPAGDLHLGIRDLFIRFALCVTYSKGKTQTAIFETHSIQMQNNLL